MVSPTSRRGYLQAIGAGSVVGLTGLAGCLGDSGGGDSISFSVATTFNPEHTQAKLASRFADNLDSETDGRINVDVLTGSVGSEEDQIEAVASGTVKMHGTSMTSLTAAHGQEYGFLEAPFVAQGWEHYLAMADEFVYADGTFNDKLISSGNQRILGESERGLRGTTSNKAIKQPSDIEGVKMRLPQFETWVKTWEEIGAAATPVAFDELYSALETGVVDASEGPIQQFIDTSLYEVQTHFSQTQHLLQTLQWVINEDFWQGLSSDDQQLLQDSIDEATQWANDQTRTEVEDLLTEAEEEHGTVITRAEDIEQQAFIDAGTPALENFFNTIWSPDFQEIQDLA